MAIICYLVHVLCKAHRKTSTIKGFLTAPDLTRPPVGTWAKIATKMDHNNHGNELNDVGYGNDGCEGGRLAMGMPIWFRFKGVAG